MESKKKPTNSQLQKRIDNAILHIDNTKFTKSIYFSDKGLRITVNEDYAIIETVYHRHIFQKVTSSGISKPYLYTQEFLDIALSNDCQVEDGYSYTKLFDNLKQKEDKADYSLAVYVDWWLLIIFNNLYSISEDTISSFIVYFKYMSAVAINSIILEEHKEDMTTKDFVNKYVNLIKEFTEGINNHLLFVAMTDQEMIDKEIDAMSQMDTEELIENSKKNLN